jgi:hypothetical protein
LDFFDALGLAAALALGAALAFMNKIHFSITEFILEPPESQQTYGKNITRRYASQYKKEPFTPRGGHLTPISDHQMALDDCMKRVS